MSPILPDRDYTTTYDYVAGEKRMVDVKKGRYQLKETKQIYTTPMNYMVYTNGSVDHVRMQSTRYVCNLQVTDPEGFAVFYPFIPKAKIVELAAYSIAKWGREYAEMVLSAAKKGSLYFHIIYHFGSFEILFDKMDRIENECESDETDIKA